MDRAGRTALLVVNSQSGPVKGLDPALAALEAGGLALIRRDPGRETLGELIRSMRNEVNLVVLAGGDGTLSAGAIALRDTGLSLGVLPTGIANDLARVLDIPLDPVSAAGVILAGHTRRITLGIVNGQPFFTAASVGLSMEHTRALQRAARPPLGQMRFAAAAFRALMHTRRFSAIIRCGPTVHRVRTVQVTVGNGRFYSGGVVTAGQDDAAEPATLNVFSLEPPTRWALMSMARAFRGDGRAVPEVRLARSSVVELVTRLPQTIYADGEKISLTPARFGLLPDAVSIFVPADAPPPAPDSVQAEDVEAEGP